MKVNEVLPILEIERLVVIINDNLYKFKWNNWDSYRDCNDIRLQDKYGEREIMYISVNKYNELELAIK